MSFLVRGLLHAHGLYDFGDSPEALLRDLGLDFGLALGLRLVKFKLFEIKVKKKSMPDIDRYIDVKLIKY